MHHRPFIHWLLYRLGLAKARTKVREIYRMNVQEALLGRNEAGGADGFTRDDGEPGHGRVLAEDASAVGTADDRDVMGRAGTYFGAFKLCCFGIALAALG